MILSKIKCFSGIAEMVLHHHERWNGEGYPYALAEKEIPLGSRIIAVADSIDAMLSDRTYRQKMSAEQCRLEIQKNVGALYDPRIAQIALQNWKPLLASRDEARQNNIIGIFVDKNS